MLLQTVDKPQKILLGFSIKLFTSIGNASLAIFLHDNNLFGIIFVLLLIYYFFLEVQSILRLIDYLNHHLQYFHLLFFYMDYCLLILCRFSCQFQIDKHRFYLMFLFGHQILKVYLHLV